MIVKYLGNFLEFFWRPKFWLPKNLTWNDLEPQHEYQFTNYRHLYTYAVPLAILINILRFIFMKYVFFNWGLKLGIEHIKWKKASKNSILESAYRIKSVWKTQDISELSKRTGWTKERITTWLRQRKAQYKHTNLEKFCEYGWKCLSYSSYFTFGLYVLWDKPWFWNINHCWINYPYHGTSQGIWWYFMLTVAFYLSLVSTHFTDVKQKDFWPMFTHHVATILLLGLSWTCNLHRIGSLIILVHDAADCLLEGAKCAKYGKQENLSMTLFVMFVCVWFVTRLIIYPFWILRSLIFDSPDAIDVLILRDGITYSALFFLLALHVYWTSLLVKMISRILKEGQVGDDIRSSSSEDDSEDGTSQKDLSRIIKDSHLD